MPKSPAQSSKKRKRRNAPDETVYFRSEPLRGQGSDKCNEKQSLVDSSEVTEPGNLKLRERTNPATERPLSPAATSYLSSRQGRKQHAASQSQPDSLLSYSQWLGTKAYDVHFENAENVKAAELAMGIDWRVREVQDISEFAEEPGSDSGAQSTGNVGLSSKR